MTQPVSAEPFARIPPSDYLARLISDLLTIDTETAMGRMAAKDTAQQAARVIATFCSPAVRQAKVRMAEQDQRIATLEAELATMTNREANAQLLVKDLLAPSEPVNG